MAKAERGGAGPGYGVFVVTRGQANRIGELQSKRLDRPGLRHRQPVEVLQRPAQRRHRAEQRQPVNAQFMRRFRV